MISIQGLKKSFNGKTILDGLDLVVEPKIVTTVIGQSGCGKSVLLKHMVGIHRGDEGTVTVDGTDVGTADKEELSYLRTKFSYLFQGGALFDSLSVWENVAFPLMWGQKKIQRDARTCRHERR